MGKENVPNIVETFKALIEYLHTSNVELILEAETAKFLSGYNLPIVPGCELGKHADLLIVVGGDGSLLQAFPFASAQNLPVIGINRGRLGFLTDILPHKIEAIGAILSGKYSMEKRFFLQAEVYEPRDQLTAKPQFESGEMEIALNDVVLLSDTAGFMTEFQVYLDGQFVCTYFADGLIVATPTGSTAHALSGGGPILHPQLNALVLVPMLSHNLSSRPVVIHDNSIIELVISESNRRGVQINCDGHKQILVAKGGSIKITKAKGELILLHPEDYNYFETLRSKLHWEKE